MEPKNNPTASDSNREITAYPTDPRDRIASQIVGEDFQVESAESEKASGEARDQLTEDTPESEEALGFDGGALRYRGQAAVSLDDIGEVVDLSASQLDVAEMNEEDAREEGYIDTEEPEGAPPKH